MKDCFQLVLFFLIIVVGCDGVLGSSKVLDRCWVCGGNNRSCSVVSGILTRHSMPLGYNMVATIPAASCNVTITELRPSSNLLALRMASSSRYIINGNWGKSASGSYQGAGTTFHYRNSGELAQLITARGPLTEDVNLLIIFKDRNPGVKYEYMKKINETLKVRSPVGNVKVHDQNGIVSKSRRGNSSTRRKTYLGRRSHDHDSWARRNRIQNPTKKHRIHQYKHGSPLIRNKIHDQGFLWRVTGMTACSVPCGGGTQSSVVSCIRASDGDLVEDHLCNNADKPIVESVQCNAKPCHAKWEVQRWSACSVSCGKGVQSRVVTCKQWLSPVLNMMVPEGACIAVAAKPATNKVCHKRCNRWKPSRWSECSSTCGNGVRTRRVTCVDHFKQRVEDAKCLKDSKPVAQETCQVKPCSNIWIHSSWNNKCSVGCGRGTEQREVYCWNSRKVIADAKCEGTKKLKLTQNCTSYLNCRAKWFTGPWSHCSSECGPGTRTRDVLCVSGEAQHRIVSRSQCFLQDVDAPPRIEKCQQKPCQNQWFLSSWSQCTKTCGGGIKTRLVHCLSAKHTLVDNCNLDEKPEESRSCNDLKCPEIPKDDACMDEYKHCDIVIRARLCKYEFYKNKCCESCHDH